MARTTMESAYLGVHDQGDSVLYLAPAVSPHAIRHGAWIGQVVPLQGTALGAALRDEVRPDGYVSTRQTVDHRRADSEHARALSAQLCGMKAQRWKRTER